jgi:hypothetical protein
VYPPAILDPRYFSPEAVNCWLPGERIFDMDKMQRHYLDCPRCFTASLLEHDGCSGECLNCGARFIRHECAGNGLAGIPQEWWLLVATAASSYACPTCGEVARVAQAISKFPGLSEEAKLLLGMIAVGAIAAGVLRFLDRIFGSAQRGA